MKKLRKALRFDPKTIKYCDGSPTTWTVGECVRDRAGHLRFDPPGAGRVA